MISLARLKWSELEGRTSITPAGLDEAQALVEERTRVEVEVPAPDTGLLRQQAFTLLVKTYDQVRRAATYLRWDETDADEIPPSLQKRLRRHGLDTSKCSATFGDPGLALLLKPIEPA